MNARNIVLFAALFALFWSASFGFAGVSVCSWIVPSDDYPTCGNGNYGAALSNNTNGDIDIVAYVEIWACQADLRCEPTGSPDYYTCMTATIPANTTCNQPYTVLFHQIRDGDLCICPTQHTDGIFFLREYIWLQCTMTSSPCNDLPGNCGVYFYWGAQPWNCCTQGLVDSHCTVIDNRDLPQHRCCP